MAVTIHVVAPGDTLYAIALRYGIPLSLLMELNGVTGDLPLVVGQTLVIRIPRQTYIVRQGDTLYTISRRKGLSLRQLYRRNPGLKGLSDIWPGQTLVLSYEDEPLGSTEINAYAYPYIDASLLRQALPFLTWLTPFTYGFNTQGELTPLEDEVMIAMARDYAVSPLMSLSNLIEEEGFSSALASLALNDAQVQRRLLDNTMAVVQGRGYAGVDVDFEYVPAQDAQAFAAFLTRLRARLAPLGLTLTAALAPKVSADQPGALYEGHDYRLIGCAVDAALLMTYEWGYAYGSPMAVAPLPAIRRVLDYAVTEMRSNQIFLGIPTYGYDWTLPYVQGQSRAVSLSSPQAVGLAARYGAEIQYDETSQSPWFRYRDEAGQIHEVWFEDARSIQAKLALVAEYGLRGAGYWNLMRPFPQNWQVLDAMFEVRP